MFKIDQTVNSPKPALLSRMEKTSNLVNSERMSYRRRPPRARSLQSRIQLDSQTPKSRDGTESLVNDFRGGKKSRVESYAAILGELEHEPILTREEKDATFQLYSAEIDSAEARAHRQLAITGTRTETVAPKQDELVPRHSDVESGSDEDDDREPRKKRRLRESDMPWFGQDEDSSPSSNPSSIKTVRLLRTYNKDVKKCKFYVSIAPGVPDSIPPSQWERIFKGESIDLDQILSALYRVTISEERKAHWRSRCIFWTS